MYLAKDIFPFQIMKIHEWYSTENLASDLNSQFSQLMWLETFKKVLVKCANNLVHCGQGLKFSCIG